MNLSKKCVNQNGAFPVKGPRSREIKYPATIFHGVERSVPSPGRPAGVEKKSYCSASLTAQPAPDVVYIICTVDAVRRQTRTGHDDEEWGNAVCACVRITYERNLCVR